VAETELREFQAEVERARTQLSDLDGAVGTAETRREEAAARMQALRDRQFALSREEVEVGDPLGTRRAVRAASWSRGSRPLGRGAAVARVEGRDRAQVTGLRSGLSGLLESESVQRERVTALQAAFYRGQGRGRRGRGALAWAAVSSRPS